MMTASDLSDVLGGRKSGTGYIARCPAHEDRNPSLSITDSRDGKVLFRCHAGCSQSAVIDALRSRGLWTGKTDHVGQPRSTSPRYRPPAAATTASNCVQRKIVNEYNYTDAAGKFLYQIVRFEPKDFRQRYRDGMGKWVWKKNPCQVLYHLPELLTAQIVFIVEGEKDVETMRDFGFVATTKAGGAKSPWLDSYTTVLRDREVVIISDNDSREKDFAGQRSAVRIAEALQSSAKSTRIISFGPGVKDVSDWFAAGHSEIELIQNLERTKGK